MGRIFCILTGYLCGSFLTAELVAQERIGKSAFEIGRASASSTALSGKYRETTCVKCRRIEIVKRLLPWQECDECPRQRYTCFKQDVSTSKTGFLRKRIFPAFKPKIGGRKNSLRWIHIFLGGGLHLKLIHSGLGLGNVQLAAVLTGHIEKSPFLLLSDKL